MMSLWLLAIVLSNQYLAKSIFCEFTPRILLYSTFVLAFAMHEGGDMDHGLFRDVNRRTIPTSLPPTLTCATEDLVLECNSDYTGAIALWLSAQETIILDLAIDNCNSNLEITNSYISGSEFLSCDQSEGLVVTFYVTDDCGNTSTCTASIYIDDTMPPVIIGAPDVTIECGDPLPKSSVQVLDACDANLFLRNPIDSEPVGSNPQIITRTYYVQDACDNLSSCTQRISILDTEGPMIINPGAIILSCEEGIPQIDIEAMDCSGIGTLNYTDSSPSEANCEMLIVRTLYVSDIYGNSSSCTHHILIHDDTPPQFVSPGNISIGCNDPLPVEMPTTIDNCDDDVFVTIVNEEIIPDACGYTLVRMFRAWDNCEGSSSCIVQITVADDTPPVLTCEDIELVCTEKTCLTFDDIIVNSFTTPVIVSDVAMGGVTINVKAYQKGGILLNAALYNTESPHPDDLDLGTPNTLYGGPGENDDNSELYNVSNNQSVGNAIIVQTPGSLVPNDYLFSDSLVFTFSEPVFVESLIAVDFENAQINTGAGVYTFDHNGVSQGFVPLSSSLGEDNSVEEVSLRRAGVKKLKVYYGTAIPGSGGVARLCFIHTPIPEAYDECSAVTITSEYETMIVIDDCLTELSHTYSATDACGNETFENNSRIIAIHTDSQQPDIIAPADISISCDDPVPAPDVNAVVVTDGCGDTEDITIEWVQDITTGIACNQEIRRIYRAVDTCGNEALAVQFIKREPQVQLSAKAYLSGPFIAGSMTTLLNSLTLIVNAQPYSGPPYSYPGAEYKSTFSVNIVDWVFIELRDQLNNATVVARRSALLTSSGDIVDLDGISPVVFSVGSDFYYVAIHHRNHVGVLSDAAVDFSTGMGTMDFTTGNSGQLQVTSGVWALVKGDVNVEGLVNNTDLVAIAPEAAIGFSNVYNLYDVNMDGLVNNTDLVQLSPLAAIGYSQNF